MAEKVDGGSAFPQHADTGNLEDWRMGMSLRDYFAGQALGGLVAAYRATPEAAASLTDVAKAVGLTPQEVEATVAYEIADAMLAERGR